MPGDRDDGEVDEVWAYRGRQRRLVRGPLGYEPQVWERGVRKAS